MYVNTRDSLQSGSNLGVKVHFLKVHHQFGGSNLDWTCWCKSPQEHFVIDLGKSLLVRGIIPKWPYFRLVNYYNLPRLIAMSAFLSYFQSAVEPSRNAPLCFWSFQERELIEDLSKAKSKLQELKQKLDLMEAADWSQIWLGGYPWLSMVIHGYPWILSFRFQIYFYSVHLHKHTVEKSILWLLRTASHRMDICTCTMHICIRIE